MTAASQRRQYQQLELDVERAEVALVDARKVFDGQGPEAREAWRVRVAERKLEQAKARLKDPVKVILTEAEKAEAEERRLARRAPPDLQALVLDHGAWDRITPEAWAKFDANMAEWKRKIREGLFDAKVW
jgi:Trm5-related predicted tRNA methylase